jgi:type I restriction enzyme, S subunit
MRPLSRVTTLLTRGRSPSYVKSGGVCVVNQKCIRDGRIQLAFARRAAMAGREEDERKLRRGDVLVNSTGVGTLGRVAPVYEVPEEMVVDSHITIARPDVSELDFAFFGYAVLAAQTSIEDLAEGSTGQTELSRRRLGALEIPVPPRNEQNRIALVLRALDDKIDSNRRLAALLEETVTTVFRARFVDFIGVEEFEESEIGPIPLGWSVTRVDALAAINAVLLNARNHPDRIAYVDISSVGTRNITEIADLAFDEAPTRARRVVQSGDTLVSTVRPERRSLAFVHDALPGMTASTGFAVVTPRLGAPCFVYQCVTSDACTDHLVASATGSAYPAVNPTMLAAWRIPVPPDNGAGFEEFARPIEAWRHRLVLETVALASIRDALLPKLISGEIRVPDTDDPEEVIGPAAEELTAATQ